MKTFSLIRTEDVKTVSGVGRVAVGIDYGTFVALTWITDALVEGKTNMYKVETISTFTMFNSVSDVQKLHGHGIRTEVIYNSEFDLKTMKLIQNKMNQFEKALKIA